MRSHWLFAVVPGRGHQAAMALAAALLVSACTSGSTPATSPSQAAAPAPSATPLPVASASPIASASRAPSVAPSVSLVPTTFTSSTYGYSLLVPAGWHAIQATAAWDGKGAPAHDVPQADQFIGPAAASSWLFAAPTTKNLAARVKETIAANFAVHGDTCPAVPEAQDEITIGGEPGVLIAYNCGILINIAVGVHKGMAYVFGFRDPAVQAATDPADRATFLKLLESVNYPD